MPPSLQRFFFRGDGPPPSGRNIYGEYYSIFRRKMQNDAKTVCLAPHLVGDLLNEAKLRPLLLCGELVADLAGRKAALRA